MHMCCVTLIPCTNYYTTIYLLFAVFHAYNMLVCLSESVHITIIIITTTTTTNTSSSSVTISPVCSLFA